MNRNAIPTKNEISLNFDDPITPKEAKNLAITKMGENVEIVDYSITPYSDEKIGFLGSHKRLVIKARANDRDDSLTTLSASFFVKTVPYDVPTQAEYIREKGVFEEETNFFGNIVPALVKDFNVEPWSPDCHLIKNDCLVFEDLRQRGFAMSRKLLNAEELKSGLSAIARLHAASLHAEKRLKRRLNVVFPSSFVERAFVDRGNQYLWYLAGVDVAVRIAEDMNLDSTKISRACSTIFQAVKPSRNKRNVVSHGDLWSNNLMFDDSQPPHCRMVDFQLLRYSPLGHDVAQFLHLCSSKKFRDSNTREMIDHYYECLTNCLKRNSRIHVESPSREEVELAYEEQKLGACVTAVMYFPTVLLDGRLGAEIMNDSKSYEKFVMRDRRDVVVNNMKRDEDYRRRIEETVRELVDYSKILERLPVPC